LREIQQVAIALPHLLVALEPANVTGGIKAGNREDHKAPLRNAPDERSIIFDVLQDFDEYEDVVVLTKRPEGWVEDIAIFETKLGHIGPSLLNSARREIDAEIPRIPVELQELGESPGTAAQVDDRGIARRQQG
jgi:hypothetical protein